MDIFHHLRKVSEQGIEKAGEFIRPQKFALLIPTCSNLWSILLMKIMLIVFLIPRAFILMDFYGSESKLKVLNVRFFWAMAIPNRTYLQRLIAFYLYFFDIFFAKSYFFIVKFTAKLYELQLSSTKNGEDFFSDYTMSLLLIIQCEKYPWPTTIFFSKNGLISHGITLIPLDTR